VKSVKSHCTHPESFSVQGFLDSDKEYELTRIESVQWRITDFTDFTYWTPLRATKAAAASILARNYNSMRA
jgi:hypothetical protein